MKQASKTRNALGNVFRVFRQRAKLSQEALAEIAGVHRTYISQVERGVRNPSFNSMNALLRGCGVSWEEFGEAIDQELRKEKE